MGFSVPQTLKDYKLLGPDILLSHATGSTDEEFELLKEAGVHISCTPSTESQMAHGDLVGFRDDTLGSLGADCNLPLPTILQTAYTVGPILTLWRSFE